MPPRFLLRNRSQRNRLSGQRAHLVLSKLRGEFDGQLLPQRKLAIWTNGLVKFDSTHRTRALHLGDIMHSIGFSSEIHYGLV